MKDHRLDAVAILWHLINFFAPALGVGLIASASAKLLWRRELKPVGWLRLAVGSTLASALVLAGGLVVFDHDGKMATYAAMVGACAVTLWWIGFKPVRRRPER